MTTYTGQGISRVDGPDKVCGRAMYAGDVALPRMAHAWLVQSTVPMGRIATIDAAAAARMPGVALVLTHLNAQKLPEGGKAAVNPPAGRVLSLLQDDTVAYNGQPIAVVVADTLQQARHAAAAITVRYAASPASGAPVLDFDRAKAAAYPPKEVQQQPADTRRGDMDAGRASATARVEARYTTPVEHHNPMEPHATVAAWDGDRLTLYDATQYVSGDRDTVAKTLGIAPERVTVICPFVGGGFGNKGSTWSHVVLAAMAARSVGRPVKLVLDRTQMFAPVGHRPHTEQALWLGAGAGGVLTAVHHGVVAETSTLEDWIEPSAIVTRMLYSSAAQSTSHRLVKMNIGTPTFTRAPGEASGSFALECAMDELAYAAAIDPLQLRLVNHAEQDAGKGKPFSSKSLRACYATAADRFGWQRRDPAPGRMRDGRWRVGMGMATATYPTNRSAASAEVRVFADGSALVRSGTQDLGTGTYTVMTQVAADALGLPLARVRFELGDSRLPKAPVSGGSQSAASVGSAVKAACEQAQQQLLARAVADPASPLHGLQATGLTLADGVLRARSDPRRAEPLTALLARGDAAPLVARAESKPGAEKEAYSMHSFGAVFTEVRVDEDLGVVQVPRIVGAYGIGNVLNAKTAHSQLVGGIVWGVGMALLEETVRDLRNGRAVNGNLAEYHVPVNADIGSIDVSFVPETDPHVNPLGIKGIGEIGITGVVAAIANAVFHATGKRVRDLPITLDKVRA